MTVKRKRRRRRIGGARIKTTMMMTMMTTKMKARIRARKKAKRKAKRKALTDTKIYLIIQAACGKLHAAFFVLKTPCKSNIIK